MPKSKLLRDKFRDLKILRVAGAYNSLFAKIVENIGFDAVWVSGLELSTSRAVPDASILTMTDFADASRLINRSVNIPVIADCDAGFGTAANVHYMVKEYECNGVAAICIEDKTHPKLNSLLSGMQTLVPADEFAGKIHAAKDAQSGDDFMVIARTEAMISGMGCDEALRRAYIYRDAGADAILVHSKSNSHNQIAEFMEHWDMTIPVVIVPTTYPITVDEAYRLGIKMIIYANHGIRAAVKACNQVYSKILIDGTTQTVENDIAPVSDLFELQGIDHLRSVEKRFVRR